MLVCWSGLVLGGTYAVLETTVLQHLARSYATTRGKIVVSQVGHGVILRRGVDIAYNYFVNGVEYTGHRYRYDDHNMTLSWDVAVGSMPHWSFETVYYNPSNPADSLLSPGVAGEDLLLLMFALPFIVLTGVLWRILLLQIQDRVFTRQAGGVSVSRRAGETRVALRETSLFGAACYGMAAAAFVSTFPVIITTGFKPSLSTMQIAWGIVVLTGLGALGWRLVQNLSGADDLRINQTSQLVVLPATGGRAQPITIPRTEITGVSMQRRVNKSPSGTHFSYLPSLKSKGPTAGAGTLKLVTWGWTEARARSFTQWLGQELGVEFKGIEDESPEQVVRQISGKAVNAN